MKNQPHPKNLMALCSVMLIDYLKKEYKKFQRDLTVLYRDDVARQLDLFPKNPESPEKVSEPSNRDSLKRTTRSQHRPFLQKIKQP